MTTNRTLHSPNRRVYPANHQSVGGVAILLPSTAAYGLMPALTLGVGLLLAVGFLLVSPITNVWYLVWVPVGAAVAWLIWTRPEFGVLAICFFGTGLISRELINMPLLARFGADPADLILLTLLLRFVVTGLRQRSIEIPQWSISGPLIAFAGFAVFSALYARIYQGVPLGLVVGELRPAMYCVGIAIAVVMSMRRHQLTTLLIGLFIIADLTVGAALLGQFHSAQSSLFLSPGELWQVDQLSDAGGGFGAVRVVPPAHVLLYLMANIAFCLSLAPLPGRRLRMLLTLQFLFLMVGLVLSYTRAQWVASGIAVLLMCALLPWPAKRHLGRVLRVAVPGLALLLFGVMLTPIGGVGVSQTLVSRAESIFSPNDTLGTSSLQWRSFEDQAVVKMLRRHPLLGVGLGNDYREVTLFQGEASGWLYPLDGPSSLTRFVHNSYLYLAAKMGLVAIGMFVWFCLAFLIRGTRIYAATPNGPTRLVVLAVLCSFAGLLEWAVFQPHFMLPASMAAVGLMVGIVAAAGSGHLGMLEASGTSSNAERSPVTVFSRTAGAARCPYRAKRAAPSGRETRRATVLPLVSRSVEEIGARARDGRGRSPGDAP